MENLEKKIRQIFNSATLARTRPRTKILEVLLKSRKPLTQKQITEYLGENSPDKVTIYRTLEQLLQKGIVHKAYVQRRQWYFELSDNCSERACHPHFTCRECGQISCLVSSGIGRVKNLPAGFSVCSMQVRLEGFCPQCAAQADARVKRPQRSDRTG